MLSTVNHPFKPVFDEKSSILILGTIPSPQSRAQGFYYSHPQNEFWHVLSTLLADRQPQSSEEKRAFLLRHGIAVWDVLHSCEIKGASDQHIQNPVPNDFSVILQTAPIQKIFTTGKKATALYQKYCAEKTGFPAFYLPSTSPANRRWYPFDRLLEAYRVILPYLP